MSAATRLHDAEVVKDIRKKKKVWQDKSSFSKKKRQHAFHTLSGIPIKSLYTPANVSDLNYIQ